MSKATDSEIEPLGIAVLTVSDTRGENDDTSGHFLVEALQDAGHQLADKVIVKDDIYQVRMVVARWIAEDRVDACMRVLEIRPRVALEGEQLVPLEAVVAHGLLYLAGGLFEAAGDPLIGDG